MSGTGAVASAWLPASPCGDGCLPAAGSVPRVSRGRQLCRLLAVAAVLLAGLLVAVVLPLLPGPVRERVLRWWFRGVLTALGIRVEVGGAASFAPPGAAVLVVSNHVSWLDLVALSTVRPLRMVAKSEVAGWPLVGMLARRAHTIFVHREQLSRLPAAVGAARDALRAGGAVGVFPEGTTWCGLAGGRFRPAFFQAAVDSGALVRPVALRYRLTAAGRATVTAAGRATVTAAGRATVTAAGPAPVTTVAAFVGSTTLWRAVLTLVAVRDLVVELRLLPLLDARVADRRELAAGAGAAVGAVTTGPMPSTGPVPEPGPVHGPAPGTRRERDRVVA